MRGLRRLGGQIIVVADFERIVVLFDFLFVGRLIRTDEGNVPPIRTPRELLDALRRVSDFLGFAAAHWQNKNLWPRIFSTTDIGDKSKPVPVWRPPWRAGGLPLVGQGVLRSAGYVNLHQLALRAVLLEILPPYHNHDGLPVRRNLRVGNRNDLHQIV